MSFTLTLPFPPTLNNLFVNVPGRGRVPSKGYMEWRKRAAERLWTNRVRAVTGPVEISITVEDKGQRDLDNCAKGLLDFLVTHQLIEGDSRKTVRRIVLEWGDVRGAVVTVLPFTL